MSRMRQRREYKSPYAAAVWSMMLPGFGQFYNKDYVIGLILIGFEFLINLNSNLNLALVYSFTGDFAQAHSFLNYRWGMFYPSLYAFSIWQAFNSAKAYNDRFLENVLKKRTYLTGFFIGLVVGMDAGLFWHNFPLLNQFRVLSIFNMPVFSGLLFGLLGAWLGHFIEITIFHKNISKSEVTN
jgi:TM2 domain-containing membrane protein YozV